MQGYRGPGLPTPRLEHGFNQNHEEQYVCILKTHMLKPSFVRKKIFKMIKL